MDPDCRQRTRSEHPPDPSLRRAFRLFSKILDYSPTLIRILLSPFRGRIPRHHLTYVDPNEITHTVSRDDPTLKGNNPRHFGSVGSGDWDLEGIPVREYWNLFPILKQRVVDQKAYEDIPEFAEILQTVDNGGEWYNCRSRKAVQKHWRSFEALYWTIKDAGYLSQAELGRPRRKRHDEVRIQVSRKGDLLFEEGFHRLVIAQLLGLDQIPVIVYRRHAEWVKLREAVKKIVLKRGFFHQPFNHPDLDVLPQRYGSKLKDQAFYGNERWEYILDSLPMREGTVLDIGAYFGYFCHRFDAIGFDCFAVEKNRENHDVLVQYRDMMKRQFTVWHRDLFELDRHEFDVVLALNVFHHLVKEKASYDRLARWLNRLRCKVLYLETGDTGPYAYRDLSEKDFVEFVIANSCLNNRRLLGPTKVKRNLYMLTP